MSEDKKEMMDELVDKIDQVEQTADMEQEKKHKHKPSKSKDKSAVTDPPEAQPASEQEQLQEQHDALNERFLRTVAEYDNYRKRTEREKRASAANGCCNAIELMLPVLDTLESAAAAHTEDADYKKGVQMTLDMFRNTLAALGIEEIEALGKPFDPELHCAVSREQKEDAESGTVTMVMQKGYKMGDRIIRYSMVMVAE